MVATASKLAICVLFCYFSQVLPTKQPEKVQRSCALVALNFDGR